MSSSELEEKNISAEDSYGSDAILVLEGLDAVRKGCTLVIHQMEQACIIWFLK